jgi:hypothetical protein
MNEGRPGRGGGAVAPMNRVTKNIGLNRMTWDVTHSTGLTAPPGRYQAKLTFGTTSFTQPCVVRIDPRVAEDGVTAADLRALFDHNMKMRELTAEGAAAVARTRAAENRLRTATGAGADTLQKIQAIAAKLITPTIRYSQPGLQSHITYLAGMTARSEQKVGRDALERYAVLRKELDAIKAELVRVLGPEIRQ